jgi:hypothetical protein
MRLEINARGLPQAEIQAAIDLVKQTKGVPYNELVKLQRERILELLRLDTEFSEMALDFIRQHHPELL